MQSQPELTLPGLLEQLEIAVARAELALCHERLRISWGHMMRYELAAVPAIKQAYDRVVLTLHSPHRCLTTLKDRLDELEALLDRPTPEPTAN